MPQNIQAKKVRSMMKEAIAAGPSGTTGACLAIRGAGPVTQCSEMSKGACDYLNEELQKIDDRSFAIFMGNGTTCE
jgi:hypothetical protein